MIIYALPPIVPAGSKILILGTMPGEKSIALQQYYGNKGNQFWKILSAVFDEPFSTEYSDRMELLQRHKIALWNTLASCERAGSRDDKVRNPAANDFRKFYEEHPTITKVYFESISASRFYSQYAYRSDQIEYTVLPSTSGLNSRIPYSVKLSQWRQLK